MLEQSDPQHDTITDDYTALELILFMVFVMCVGTLFGVAAGLIYATLTATAALLYPANEGQITIRRRVFRGVYILTVPYFSIGEALREIRDSTRKT